MMSSNKRSSPIKAYSMLNSSKRRSMFPSIKNLSNLPTFKSHSKNYNGCILNENRNNSQNDEPTVKYDSKSKFSNGNSKPICISNDKKIIIDDTFFISFFALPSPKSSKFDQIFKEKIKVCKSIFHSTQIKEKNEKINALNEINTLISKRYEVKFLTADHKNQLLEMIMVNIFMQDLFISTDSQLKPIERSLEHVSLIYKILNQFVFIFPEKCKIDLFKKGIRLLNLQDFNENLVDFLTNYTKSHLEEFKEIWKVLKAALVNVKYDIYTPYCVNPIISYMNSFFIPNGINNLSNILCTHILPLYTHEDLLIYFNKLNDFIMKIVENRVEDQLIVIQYLIKHFPYQCGQKQPFFISTLNSILNIMDENILNSISAKLFHFLAMAIKSPNSRLAESALSLLMQENMRPIITSNYELATSILYSPLKWSYALHWDNFIKEQSRNALAMLINTKYEFNNNKALYHFLNIPGTQSQQKTDKINKLDSSKVWSSIYKLAAKKYKSAEIKKSICRIKTEFAKGVMNKECMKLKENLH